MSFKSYWDCGYGTIEFYCNLSFTILRALFNWWTIRKKKRPTRMNVKVKKKWGLLLGKINTFLKLGFTYFSTRFTFPREL